MSATVRKRDCLKRKLKSKDKRSILNGNQNEKKNHLKEIVEPIIFSEAPILNSPEKCFAWLLYPIKPSTFIRDIWEQKPLLVRRAFDTYYDGLFSCSEIERILRKENILFSRNLDITKYENGKRETLNADGRAYAPIVWDHYQNGCSVRLLNPQTYSIPLWKLNSTLQEYFGSFVGANVYLTPAGSQGFAPHYDDIEAFILQVEGKKLWKVYAPLASEELPRYSSGNFKEENMEDPILEVELVPGDLLYFPRGFIHQAKTTNEVHSLHITLSTYQKNTWGDYFEKLLPFALRSVISKDVDFRRGLPRRYLKYMGLASSDTESKEKLSFEHNIKKLLKKITEISLTQLDAVADQMGKRFLEDALPPFITKCQQARSIHGSGETWRDGQVEDASELDPDSRIRLIKSYAVRLVLEDNCMRIYHSFENTRLYHEMEPQYVEISHNLAQGAKQLLDCYPSFITVDELNLDTLEEKMELASLLYEKGLLQTKDILEVFDD